jgi:GT2 family glycosyltransferase
MKNGSTPGLADIVLPVRNEFSRTRALLEGIYRFSDWPFHIYLIDNGSTDETADLDKVYARDITVVHNREDRGWSSGIDQGIAMGNGPYLVIMSYEADVSQGWLGNLLAFLDSHPRIGAVGPLTSCSADWQGVDKVRESLVPEIPQFLTEDPHERSHILSYHFRRAGILVDGPLSFLCVALRRRVVEKVGPFHRSASHDNGEDYWRRIRKARYVTGLALDTYVGRKVTTAPGNDRPTEHRREPRGHSFARVQERNSLRLAAARR